MIPGYLETLVTTLDSSYVQLHESSARLYPRRLPSESYIEVDPPDRRAVSTALAFLSNLSMISDNMKWLLG